jgi:poly(3-hydroxybutyrate) depolymerase
MRAAACPPGIVNAGVDSMFASYTAVLRATSDYWTGAVARGANVAGLGIEVADWFTAVTRRTRPRWATEHAVVRNWPIARLLDFSDAGPAEEIPTLFLPPQAGHDSCIVDFGPRQSQIATAKQAGLTRVLSLDWLGATAATKNAVVEDYIAVVADSIESLGGRVNLVGDCQGGWLAVIYAALFPKTVHSLSIAGAPVDFHAGEPLIHDWIGVLSPVRNLDFYRGLVRSNNGVLPGKYLLGGFIAMQPDVELDRQLQLLVHIRDAQHVARYRAFEDWFKHTQPIAGAFYLWIVEHLFQNNELIAGTLVVGGRRVDLADITCPLYLLAGTTDHITPGAQVFALADYAGTAASDVNMRLVPGGHLGLFMGHEALDKHWAPLFGAIAGGPGTTNSASVADAPYSRR